MNYSKTYWSSLGFYIKPIGFNRFTKLELIYARDKIYIVEMYFWTESTIGKTTIVHYDLLRYKGVLVVVPDKEEVKQVVLDKFFFIYNI